VAAGWLLPAPELLAQHLDVFPHLVGRFLDAFVGRERARVVGVDRRLLRRANRPVVVLLA